LAFLFGSGVLIAEAMSDERNGHGDTHQESVSVNP
jgi:hypothetical protein